MNKARTICILISALMILPARTVCQADSSQRTFEIGGSAWFENSYSEQTHPLAFFNRTNQRDRHLLVNPIVGFYLTPSVELIGELSYEYTWNTTYWLPNTGPSPYDPIDMHSHMHTTSIGIGLRYNFELGRAFVPFIGLGGEVTWMKLGIADNNDPIDYQPWTSPSYQLPVASIGCRYFVNDDWAAMLEFNYRGYAEHPLIPYYRTRSYSLAVGLTTFL